MGALYRIRRHDIQMFCETKQQMAVAKLIETRAQGRLRDIDFWGNVSFDCTPMGEVIVKAPINARNIGLFEECGAEADMDDETTSTRMKPFLRNSDIEFEEDLPAVIIDRLMPFQKEGVEWLQKRNLNAILSFSAGLGKTLTSLVAMNSRREDTLPCVVLAPAHVKLNWQGEWSKWGFDPEECVVLFGRTPDAGAVKDKKLIVLNHHILAGWSDVLHSINPKTLLIDEAHNFVNHNTKTYPYVEKLAKQCDRVLMLTATALVNDLGNLWGLCNLLNKDILGTRKNYIDVFMPEEKAKQRLLTSRWRGGFNRSSWRDVAMAKHPKAVMQRRIKELADVLHEHVILRKKRKDVLTQLPHITETKLRLDIPTSTKEGRAFWNIDMECRTMLEEAKEDILMSDKIFGALAKMRAAATQTKMPDATAWIENFLQESDEGEKLIVVGWSVAPLEDLHKHFRKQSVIVNGKIDARRKHERGKEFAENKDKRILFGNIKSIGTGIDLVSASTMLMLELPMTAVDFEQVKGRIDRLSQESQHLSYYYMTIKDSLEEKMGWAIINRKQKLTEDLGL